MKINQLLKTLSLYIFLSSTAHASLIEVDINKDGTNIGFTTNNSSLVWLDLAITNNFSILEVNQRLTTDLQGYRWAKETEVLALWHDIFFSKMGQASLPILTGEAIPYVSGVWFGTRVLSAGGESDSFFDALFILGANPIETGTNNIDHTYSSQSILGYFESQYNNYGYAISNVNDKSIYRGCDPSPCFEESLSDRASVWYFDGATPLSKDNPHSGFSNAGSFLVKATKVSEPFTLAIFALGLMGLAVRRFKKTT